MRDLGQMRHDRTAYISAARERIRSLEELMLEEIENDGDNIERDSAWDSASVRADFGSSSPGETDQ